MSRKYLREPLVAGRHGGLSQERTGDLPSTQRPAWILQDQLSAPARQAEQLGIELAERLLAAGAGEILAEVYGAD